MLGSTDPICHDFIHGSTVLFPAPRQLFKKSTQSVLWAIFTLFTFFLLNWKKQKRQRKCQAAGCLTELSYMDPGGGESDLPQSPIPTLHLLPLLPPPPQEGSGWRSEGLRGALVTSLLALSIPHPLCCSCSPAVCLNTGRCLISSSPGSHAGRNWISGSECT